MSIFNANQNVAGQTGDNVVIGGATYAIVTDWGSGGGTGFTAAHIQIVKTAWGDNHNTYRTSKVEPLPVQLFDGVQGTTGALIDGENNALKITGGVNINQKLEVYGGMIDGHNKPMVTGIIQIVGPTFGKSGPTAYGPGLVNASNFESIKVTGSFAGYSGGYPIGITFGGRANHGQGEGLIRRLYGGPIGYTGITGYKLINNGAGTNNTVLDRDIDTIAVQGLSGGTPVGITAMNSNGLLTRRLTGREGAYSYPTGVHDAVSVEGFAGMTAIQVTGGVRLSHMPAGGSFEIRSLEAGRDNVAIWGADGTTAGMVKLLSGQGVPIGASAGALKVAVDNGAFNITANIEQAVQVVGATTGGIRVRGVTAEEIVIKGPLGGGAVEVASPSGLNIRTLTTSDKVSVGGDVAKNLETVKSTISSINSRMTGIETSISNINQNTTLLHSEVTSIKEDGLDTVVTESKQPEELISLTVSLSTTPRSLSRGREIKNGIYVQADPTNTSNVLVGGPDMVANSALGFVLEPGDNIFLQISNLNKIYVKSASGTQRISCIGS